MKFGQNITWEIFLLKNHVQNEAGRLVSDLFLLFKKALFKVKASGQHLNFNILGSHQLGHTIKINCRKFQTADPEIGSILIF